MHLSSCICCYHKYQVIRGRIGMDCSRELNTNDPHTVDVMKGKEIVGHVPRKIPGYEP